MAGASARTKRVVVTGLGCVTPLGGNYASTLEAAWAGRSGAGAITHFDPSEFSCRIAAEYTEPLAPDILAARDLRRTNRCVLFALEATAEALADSGLRIDDGNRNRIGVAIGSGIGGLGTILENDAILREKGPRRVSPFTIPMGIANMSSGMISVHYSIRGPNICHVSACASGAHAIGEAAKLIERGQADVMIVGGAEAPILGVTVAGFASMKALSTRNDDPERASRPFDRGRDGFVVGEGAGVLVIESLEHAQARGASIRAEVMGYGATADATHAVAPDPAGEAASRCMDLALEDAGIRPEDVGYVNAHATSTPAGDPAEVVALRRTFGDYLDRLPVSATKSMTGHLLGAAGSVEAILSIGAMEGGRLPPTINLDDPDPACALDHVANRARSVRVDVALSNSFGFGGTNASLVLGLGGL
jgi:3-oxoacyl-[acyl-carrier-protein] synthase II